MAYETNLWFLIHIDCFCVFNSLSSGYKLWFVYVEYVILEPFYQSPTHRHRGLVLNCKTFESIGTFLSWFPSFLNMRTHSSLQQNGPHWLRIVF